MISEDELLAAQLYFEQHPEARYLVSNLDDSEQQRHRAVKAVRMRLHIDQGELGDRMTTSSAANKFASHLSLRSTVWIGAFLSVTTAYAVHSYTLYTNVLHVYDT